MVEPVTTAAVAALVMKYALPAIKAWGVQVLDKSEDAASDATVGFGAKLLRRLLHHGDATTDTGAAAPGSASSEVALRAQDVAKRLDAVTAAPDDAKAVAKLEGSVEDLLDADPALLTAIRQLLEAAPSVDVRQGDRGVYVGGDNSGVIATGNNNKIRQDRP